MHLRLTVLVVLLVISNNSFSQSNKRFIKRKASLSLAPGISTNGMHSGWYINNFSFGLTSTLAAANRYFQFSGISSLNLQYATGIQLAGIANVVGSNTFINMTIGEEREQMRDGFESNMTGIQLAGLINLIRNNFSGWQTAGAINFVHDSSKGLQIAGIANMVGKDMLGIQLAGLYNVALQSSSGIQIALGSNLSNGTMRGVQLAMLNKAWRIYGRHSDPPNQVTGWQIGLVNLASKMHGLQVGIINRARQMRGVQFGLINLFSTAPNKRHGKNGIPIGLLNFGSQNGHQRIYTNETFRYNVEVTTGNCYNCTFTESRMPIHERTKKVNQNAILFSYNKDPRSNQPLWALGWGFERLHYNKNSMSANDPNNEKKFISYWVKFQHLNFEEDLQSRINLLSKIGMSYGRLFRNKLFTCYLFASVTANAFLGNETRTLDSESNPLALSQDNQLFWPGYELGIHLY